jgi:hypothetical protein
MAHAHGSTLKGLVRMGRTAEACWTWLGCVNREASR